MLDKWLKRPVHLYLYLFALIIVAVGVSISKVLMSIGTIWLIANWLLEGNFKSKLDRFKNQYVLWAIFGFFIFSIISLAWSDDINYGMHDLRIKLPLLIIPFVVGTSKPLEKSHFYLVIYLFLSGLIIASLWNYISYYFNLNTVKNIREMSSFISHIRFSISINLGIFLSIYLLLKKQVNWVVLSLIIVWLVYYQYKSQVINGYILFVVLTGVSVLFLIKNIANKKLKTSIYFLLGIGFVSLIVIGWLGWTNQSNQKIKIDYSKLELYTANGNGYYHIKNNKISENGALVYIYISAKECKRAWNKRSNLKFEGLDKTSQKLEGTLYRYMTSKNLRKDSIGFLSLDDQDIVNIENGYSNFNINKGIVEKISDLKMQWFMLQTNGNPNGNSLIQRKIHLETALDILKKHWLFGVGIGDVKLAFDEQYTLNDSVLNKENRYKSHNQYLTVWISHGIIGLFFILFLFIYPIKLNIKKCDYSVCIIIIALSFSFLWQDMIETQAGVTIFSLFYALAVFNSKQYGKN